MGKEQLGQIEGVNGIPTVDPANIGTAQSITGGRVFNTSVQEVLDRPARPFAVVALREAVVSVTNRRQSDPSLTALRRDEASTLDALNARAQIAARARRLSRLHPVRPQVSTEESATGLPNREK